MKRHKISTLSLDNPRFSFWDFVFTCCLTYTHNLFLHFRERIVNYTLSESNVLPASLTSQPTISTGVNSDSSYRTKYITIYAAPIILSPSLRMFFAALMSRSCTVPHSGQVHILTDKSFVSGFM